MDMDRVLIVAWDLWFIPRSFGCFVKIISWEKDTIVQALTKTGRKTGLPQPVK
jgi:hypothetical protein